MKAQALEDLKDQLAFERHRHDGEAVRRVVTRALGWARAIPLRNSGGMYFLNRDHAREVEQLLSFVARVAETAASSPGRGFRRRSRGRRPCRSSIGRSTARS